jgi:hypothetical protein
MTDTPWSAAPLLPFAPPENMDDDDVLVTDDGRYFECGLSDWHLLIGWLAGPGTLRRWPDDREQWWTVECSTPDGGRETSRRRETAEERRELDEMTHEYLAEHGVPNQPAGYRWFQRLPGGRTGTDVLDAAGRVGMELPGHLHGAPTVPFLRAAVQRVYGLPVTEPEPLPPEAWDPEPEDPRMAARKHAERARVAALMTTPPELPDDDDPADPWGPPVPMLQSRDLERTARFYVRLGFETTDLGGYGVLRRGALELHVDRTHQPARGACLIRVADARHLWHDLRAHDVSRLGGLEEDNPHMVSFVLHDPDGNRLLFVGPRLSAEPPLTVC